MKLRDYQEECCNSLLQDMETHRKIITIMPTGSGKTVVFGNLTKKILENYPYGRVIIVSHLGLLVSQTKDRFKEDWDINAGILQGTNIPNRDDYCVVTTMQSLRVESKINAWAKQCGFLNPKASRLNVKAIIIDECHLVGSKSYETIMDLFPEANIIGFTATPFRSNKLMTKLFDKMSYTISMQELIDKGYLVPPKLFLTPFNPFDEASMFADIVSLLKNNKDKKAVVYLKTIDDSITLRNILVSSGLTASAVTSKLTGKARDELLSEYRNGNGPQVLTTVDVLSAGFDSPNLEIIVMPYKVGSVTTYLQRVGRGLRLFKGKKHCSLYVGSESPGVKPGFWEKVTEEILKRGKAEHDNYIDEFMFQDLSVERFEWTKQIVDMAKAVEKKGFRNLSDKIINKAFPVDLLNQLVETPPIRSGKISNKPATEGQISFLEDKGIPAKNLTKQEATAMIAAYCRMKGLICADGIVQDGKYAGRYYNEVPWNYWKFLKSNNPSSEILQGYYKWRKYYEKTLDK